MKQKVTIENLIKECINNGITVSDVEIVNGELAYHIDGFSKSGTALLYYDDDGTIWLGTRYNEVDKIESFEDIAHVAYKWNLSYCDCEPFGWDKNWTKVFARLGWIETEEIKTTVVIPKQK